MSKLVNDLHRSKFHQRHVVDENASKAAAEIERLTADNSRLRAVVNRNGKAIARYSESLVPTARINFERFMEKQLAALEQDT